MTDENRIYLTPAERESIIREEIIRAILEWQNIKKIGKEKMDNAGRFDSLESANAKRMIPELTKQQGEYKPEDIRNLKHDINILNALKLEAAFSKEGTDTAFAVLSHAKQYLEKQVAARTTEDTERSEE